MINFKEKISAHNYLLGVWREAIRREEFEVAISIDNEHYIKLVRPTEDYEYWHLWQRATLADRARLTKFFEDKKPSEPKHRSKSLKTLFVLTGWTGLAHEVQLARNMSYLRGEGNKIDYDVAYISGDISSKEAVAKSASRIYQISSSSIIQLHAESFIEAGTKLDLLSSAGNYSCIVYVTYFVMGFWMSLFCRHPNQKFMTMKFTPYHSGRIAEWSCGRRNKDKEFIINGWRYTQLSILNPCPNHFLNAIKKNYKDTVNLSIGSISRPEKLSSDEYNKFILAALDRHSELHYKITGKEQNLLAIPDCVLAHPRTIKLGWVDPGSHINAFTVYIDPFPWGGGEMTLLALMSGVPYLALDTEVNREVGILSFLDFLSCGASDILKYSLCQSVDELSNRLDQLLEDEMLRINLGASWMEALNNYKPIDIDAWKRFIS